MTHPTEMLSALVDGELPGADRARVEAHVAECAACAAALRELRALDAFARDLGPAPAPAGYHEGLGARLRPRLRADRPATARPARPWLWAVAAGIALAVVAPLVLREQAAPPPAARTATTAPAAPAPVAVEDEARPAAPPPVATQPGPVAEAKVLQRSAPAQSPSKAKTVEAFAPPPPRAAAAANEADQPARAAGAVGGLAGGAPAAAAPPEEQVEAAADRRQERARAAGALADRADAASPSLKKANPDVAGARRAVLAWRRVVASDPDGPRADDARVRMIEAGAEAYRLGGDEADRLLALRDAEAYLARPDAARADHVGAIARHLRAAGRR